MNERVAAAVVELGGPPDLALLCECGGTSCDCYVTVATAAASDRRPDAAIVAPGHAVGGARVLHRTGSYWLVEAGAAAPR